MTQVTITLDDLSHVTDQELITRLQHLVRADQTLNARLLVHLGEVDARGLYREHAYASMFAYCVEALRTSEAQAYLRIQAARLGRQFPLVVQLLAQGALHLTAIKLLGPHLSADNHVQLLQRARGKGKREVELLVAAIAPKPDVPSRMRKLPDARSAHEMRRAALATESVAARQAPIVREVAAGSASGDTQARIALPEAGGRNAIGGAHSIPTSKPQITGVAAGDAMRELSSQSSVASPSLSSNTVPIDAAGDLSQTPFALEAPRHRASSKPLSPGRYKLEFTAGQLLHDKLTQLRDLLRHQVPDGDLAVLVERAVDLLIDDTMQRRFAVGSSAKKLRSVKRRAGNADSRYIPRAVLREVHERDAGQCTFVSSAGKRCCERGFLELHHHGVPYARGGKATVENLRLVCRAHNALFAERDFGRVFMRSKLRQTREPIGKLGLERVQG